MENLRNAYACPTFRLELLSLPAKTVSEIDVSILKSMLKYPHREGGNYAYKPTSKGDTLHHWV